MKLSSRSMQRLAPVLGGAAAAYLKGVRMSSRVVAEPANVADYLRSLAPGIIALWHGQFLMCPTVHLSRLPLSIVIARHDDAEVYARALSWFGMGLIRGAGSGTRSKDRGGARAFVEAAKRINAGENVAMTADYPPGPARVAGAGIAMLAKVTGRPIVPMAVATTRSYALDTWSRMTVNFPFGTLAAVHGEPIWVPQSSNEQGVEEARQRIEAELNKVTDRAYEIAASR